MTLIQSPALNRKLKKYREAVNWIAAWRKTVVRADWGSLSDLRKTYPAADGVKNAHGVVVTVFNVKGGNYRLLTVVDYAAQVVYEIDMLSHGEYDKEIWKVWQL